MKRESGFSLLEVIVALALLGIIGVLFLGSAVNSANARVQNDERATAKILAESVLDSVKKMPYGPTYTVAVPEEYAGYANDITVENFANSKIQKLTVSITRGGREILALESYKVER